MSSSIVLMDVMVVGADGWTFPLTVKYEQKKLQQATKLSLRPTPPHSVALTVTKAALFASVFITNGRLGNRGHVQTYRN